MAAPQPVAASDRVVSLDVLRGIALLGILAMNIQDFAMPFAAYWNPTAYGDLHGANLMVWAVTHTLADLKFITIFSMLFGAGILLMTSRVEAAGRSPALLHYRRMGWLTLFGLLHAHLLWTGDILFTYGICGMAAYPFRKFRPRTLIVFGLAIFSVAAAIGIYYGHASARWSPKELESLRHNLWQPTPAENAEHLATFRRGWRAQMGTRVSESLGVETFYLVMWGFWRVTGVMLIGMALWKIGVFSAKLPASHYRKMIAAAVCVGIPITLYGTYRDFAAGWDFQYSFFYGMQINYFASLIVSLGWIEGAMLASRAPALGPLAARFAAVGRTAFSNYILQTVLCTLIFYGDGLGLIGRVERVGQFAILVAIWMVQLAIAPVWLRHFYYGPLEWLWRSLTYWRREPMRRAAG